MRNNGVYTVVGRNRKNLGWQGVAKIVKSSQKGKKKKVFKPDFISRIKNGKPKKDRIKIAFKQGILPAFGTCFGTGCPVKQYLV